MAPIFSESLHESKALLSELTALLFKAKTGT